MSTKKPDDIDEQQSAAPIMLDEFCRELSADDRRVEMIAGFHADALARGQTHGTREAFGRAFTAYTKRPIAA